MSQVTVLWYSCSAQATACLQAASNLGMQCLIEVHTEAELMRVLQLQVGSRGIIMHVRDPVSRYLMCLTDQFLIMCRELSSTCLASTIGTWAPLRRVQDADNLMCGGWSVD